MHKEIFELPYHNSLFCFGNFHAKIFRVKEFLCIYIELNRNFFASRVYYMYIAYTVYTLYNYFRQINFRPFRVHENIFTTKKANCGICMTVEPSCMTVTFKVPIVRMEVLLIQGFAIRVMYYHETQKMLLSNKCFINQVSLSNRYHLLKFSLITKRYISFISIFLSYTVTEQNTSYVSKCISFLFI